MEAHLKIVTGSRVIAWGDTDISVNALAELIEKGLRHPELLNSENFRRRFSRLVRMNLASEGSSKADVLDTVEEKLAHAPSEFADTVRELLSVCLMPVTAPREDGLLPLMSRLAGDAGPREAASTLLQHLQTRFGETLSAQIWLLTPKPEVIASLESPHGEKTGEPLMIHWADDQRELGRLVVKGLNPVQEAQVEALAPWLQPIFRRLVETAEQRDALKAQTRQSHLWQLKAELLQLAQNPQTVDSYMRHVVGHVHKLFEAMQVVFWAYDPDDDSLEAKHHSRPNEPELDMPVTAGFFQEAVSNRQVKTAALKDASGQLRLFLLGPVFNEETLEGVFQVVLPTRFIGCEAEEELELVDELVASGLKTVRFYEQLSFHASHDPLTGLANRRTFEQFIQREFKLAERHQTPISLIVVDVDHFKQYNDAFGHPAGDALLREIAQAISNAVRCTDFVARYGGEEFVVVLPHTHEVGARSAAEKVIEAIRNIHQHAKVLSGQVTASVGVATYPADARNVTALLQAADQAMYRAKKDGRNRICQASE